MWKRSTPVFVCPKCDFDGAPNAMDMHRDLAYNEDRARRSDEGTPRSF
jgi:hypothetical protein